MTPTAFHAELATLLPRLRRFVRALVPAPEHADALLITALERALASPHERCAGAALERWLFGAVAQRWRAQGAATTVAVADNRAHAAGATAAIEQALAALPGQQQLLVALVLVDGMGYRQAAAIAGLAPAALTTELALARAALAAHLSDHARTVP
ncbi:RNA polymerase sigma factor [Massilia sp. DWR3-1-1]|uniref:RNA polymerase sigma factor n=1 Tax=Massilia sp. DWR3-1-1 TaxID=2804559 RepID=UPI003CF2DCA1